ISNGLMQVKMCKELPGMDTGISTPATHCFDRHPADSLQCLINQFLHTEGILLNLPAVVRPSVKCQLHKISAEAVILHVSENIYMFIRICPQHAKMGRCGSTDKVN